MAVDKNKDVVKKIPGEELSVVGFAVAIASIFTNFFTFGLTAIVGLVFSIMGRMQTSKAGRPNGLALAGIIISSVVIFLTFISFALLILLVVLASAGPDADMKSNMECEGQPFSMECRNKNQDGTSPMYEFRRDRS